MIDILRTDFFLFHPHRYRVIMYKYTKRPNIPIYMLLVEHTNIYSQIHSLIHVQKDKPISVDKNQVDLSKQIWCFNFCF